MSERIADRRQSRPEPVSASAETLDKKEEPKPSEEPRASDAATAERPQPGLPFSDTSLPGQDKWATVTPRADQPEDSWATAPPSAEKSPWAAAANLPVIAGYEILDVLGRGGMGVVYKAVHRKLKRAVALKMILAGGHAGSEQLARFRLEAEAIARIKHPNIVQIFEIGEEGNNPFIALEFVESGSLGRFRGTPQPARQAAEMVAVLARAMHVAHLAGIVHRDLKPTNVLLSPKTDATLTQDRPSADMPLSMFEPKITDFGLAKQLDTAEELSRSGEILGTPSYMAPEQAEGRIRDIGPSTDVYALAAILYDLLTGRPPFKGEMPLDTLEQVCKQEPVPPRRLQPKVPRDLEIICLKGLRKDARQRYRSAQEFADDLRRFLDAQPILARPVPAWERAWKWARREPATAAAIGAVMLAMAAGAVGTVFYGLYKEQQASTLAQRLEHQEEVRQNLERLRGLAEEAEAADQLAVAEQYLVQAQAILDNEPDAAGEEVCSRFAASRQRVGQKLDEQEAEHRRMIARQEEQIKLAAAKKDFADRTARFGRHRDQVHFHAISFRNEYVGADTAVVRREAPEALKRLGLEITKPPADFAVGLQRFQSVVDAPEKLDQLAAECYQVLLDWSAAEAAPDAEAADAKADPVLALRLLDAAEALAATHRLSTPQAFLLRRARLYEQVGNGAGAKTDRLCAAAIPLNSTIDLFESALDHYLNGQIDQAGADCERVFQREPNHFWTQYVASLCNLTRKEWITAVVRLNACLEKRRDDPWLLMHRALAHAGAGNLAVAEADFDRALRGSGDPALRADVMTNRAFMWIQKKRWPDAERDLLKAIELQPKDSRRYATLALVYRSQRKREAEVKAMEDAVTAIDEAVKRQPENAALYAVRARLQLGRGEVKAARRDFEAFLAREPKGSTRWAEALVELARLKSKAGETVAALADCDAVLRTTPGFAAAHRQRAEVLLRLDRPADAEQALDRYLAASGKETPELHRARGLIHTRFGRHLEASESFTRALLLREDAETRSLRGWASLALEAAQPALADFDAALRLEPTHTESLRGRATALFLLGRLSEAEESAKEALKQGPRAPEFLFQVACIYGIAAGQRGAERSSFRYQEQAWELLRDALELIPDEAERRTFWRDKVEKAPALVPVRGRGDMQKLARLYGSRK